MPVEKITPPCLLNEELPANFFPVVGEEKMTEGQGSGGINKRAYWHFSLGELMKKQIAVILKENFVPHQE